MRGGRVLYSLVLAVGVLLPALAEADTAARPLSISTINLRLHASSFGFKAPSFIPSLAPSSIAQAMKVANQVFVYDSAGAPGSLTDPLASRSSPFAGGRRSYGSFAWENFGGPAFGWATPSREMCARTNACLSNAPILEPVSPTFGGLIWAAGGGPVVRFGRGAMNLGPLGRASLSFEGGFFGTLVGYQQRLGSPDQRTIVGTDAAAGVAVALQRVAIHLQVQTVLFLVERGPAQPVGGQLFTTMAIDWR